MTSSNDSFLTPDEQATCEQISKSNEISQSQRARALLAINEGMTQANAAEHAGLTPGQVRYCLQRFRQLRTGIFSAQEQKQIAQAAPEGSRQPVQADTVTAEESAHKSKKTTANKKSTKTDTSDEKNKVADSSDKKKSDKKKSDKKKGTDKKSKDKKSKNKKDKKKKNKGKKSKDKKKKQGKSKKGKKFKK